jgi:hypothetical protein
MVILTRLDKQSTRLDDLSMRFNLVYDLIDGV